MPHPYTILDVFTDTPLGGNPLAVVLDADDIDGARMQAIAAEFNLSETVFVLRPTGPAHTARVRIFTPKSEIPFAGHPTVGTAVLLARQRLGEGPDERDAVVVLEEGVGPVRCGVILREGVGYAAFDAPRLAHEPGPAPASADIAAALGLGKEEIGFEHHVPSVYDGGLGFLFVPVANLDAIGRARPTGAAFFAATAAAGVDAVYCYTRETVAVGRHFHARMFSPEQGIAEDPATGSAAVSLASVIDRFEALQAGAHRFVIEQGFEIGRPSLIGLEIDREPERVAAVRVGGDAVVVAEGTLRV
ncbi:MAG: PhzF family phenazine biosynthesis protein [Bauldia sp.]|nr:PhzF family phenazine biosynthesis protein [Bauldia sp.]